jgi:transposase InsO family protein
VIERTFGSFKYEHLYRHEIADGAELAAEVEAYRGLFNTVRPHEHLDFATPISVYLQPPATEGERPESST